MWKKPIVYFLILFSSWFPKELRRKAGQYIHPRNFEWKIVKRDRQTIEVTNILKRLICFINKPTDLVLNHIFPFWWTSFLIHSMGERAPPI
jgi:hypothetical protein